jgi:hypothetical protein
MKQLAKRSGCRLGGWRGPRWRCVRALADDAASRRERAAEHFLGRDFAVAHQPTG